MAEGPLQGIRILDLTHVWAGPLANRILSDLGAEIVKIERPSGRGPKQSEVEPIGGWLGGEPGDDPWNRNAVFVKLARNRRSLCLDLKHEEGRRIFLDLVAVADIVIENFSARAMPELGLDHATLNAVNPRLIYVTAPGYGTYGPLRDWVAFGPTVECMTGLTTVLGYGPDEPRNSAMALMDPTCGTSIAAAIVTAVRRREKTGNGTYVELSLYESGISFHGPWLLELQRGGTVEPLGNRHPQMAPHGIYRCSGEDEWIAIGCDGDTAWSGLCTVIEGLEPKLDLAARQRTSDDIDATIERWTSGLTKDAAAEVLQSAGVPAGPVNTTPDMVADPQVREREFFVPYERFGTPMPGNPIKMDGISHADWTPCPALGEHNREVLHDLLHLSDAEVDELERAGVIDDRPPV